MINVFIVTDVRLYRDGLAASLAQKEGFKILGCGGFNIDTFERVCRLDPNIAIIGYSDLDCGSWIEGLVARLANCRVVVVGASDNEPEVLACAALGVSGMVSVEASLEELILTLECAARGGVRCSPKATAALVRRVATETRQMQGMRSALLRLTRREREIAALIERGYSNKDIARALDIQLSTVKNHVHKILDKLDVSNRGQAVACLRHSSCMRLADASVCQSTSV